MSTAEKFQHAISETIRDHAMTFPETEEGSSCVNRAFKAGGKNFAFLGEKEDQCNLRLKLAASIPEIAARAEDEPDRWEVGKGGWTMLRFPPDDPPPTDDLERWVTESFFLLAPKKVSKLVEP
ncbi:MAG: MmcQ/YjbR family DNA-binding protein [Acidimicrobiales bacterium]